MLEYNDKYPAFSNKLVHLIDKALEVSNEKRLCKSLGASRLGGSCTRAIQYEFLNTPKEKDFTGKVLRIFSIGHSLESLAVQWLKQGGIKIQTRKDDGTPFGFSVAGGKIRGYVDGIITVAPPSLEWSYPMLWECKSLNAKNWRNLVKYGVFKANLVYATQIALYQAYMEESFSGIWKNPALFTAINKDTAELYFELVPFDKALAQKMSDRAVHILKACTAEETLPRITDNPDFFECKWCPYRERCWSA